MTFFIKKRIDTELFIDRTTALYIVDGQIKDENVVMAVNPWDWLIRRSNIPSAESTTKMGE